MMCGFKDVRACGTVDALSGGTTETFANISESCKQEYLHCPGHHGLDNQVVFMRWVCKRQLESIYDAPEKNCMQILKVRTQFAADWARKPGQRARNASDRGGGRLIQPDLAAALCGIRHALCQGACGRDPGAGNVLDHACAAISIRRSPMSRQPARTRWISTTWSIWPRSAGISRQTCLKGNMDPVHLLTHTPPAGRRREPGDHGFGKREVRLYSLYRLPDPARREPRVRRRHDRQRGLNHGIRFGSALRWGAPAFVPASRPGRFPRCPRFMLQRRSASARL